MNPDSEADDGAAEARVDAAAAFIADGRVWITFALAIGVMVYATLNLWWLNAPGLLFLLGTWQWISESRLEHQAEPDEDIIFRVRS